MHTPTALDGPRKAAILMVLLGEEASAKILQHFDEPEIVRIGREVAALGGIEPAVAEKVLDEYGRKILTHRGTPEGGPAAARRILERGLPPDKAARLAGSISAVGAGPGKGADGENPFSALEKVRERDVAAALELEHPQTAALVLLHLSPSRAAGVLAAMNEATQASITARLARLSSVAPDALREVSEALTSRFEAAVSDELEEWDGAEAAAQILKRMSRALGRTILSGVETLDAECAANLRARVYTFEMLLQLDDRGFQEVLKGVDAKQLALALKGATPEVTEKFFRNMSTRAAGLVKDEIEYLGVAKVKDVEQAQKEILDRAIRLEEEGAIAFQGPEGSDA